MYTALKKLLWQPW